jgi:hypothetical protein
LILLFFIALALTFLALLLASQLPAPLWLWALDAVAFCAATAALSALAILSSRLGRKGWRALVLPGVAATLALGTQRWLLLWLSPPEAVPRIDFLRLQLAALSVISILFALLSGATALSRAEAWPQLLLTGAVITASLFAAGPLLERVGVPLDHRTFLSLVGLGLGAYAVVEASRKVARR